MRLVVGVVLLCLVGIASASEMVEPPPVLSKEDAEATMASFRALLSGNAEAPVAPVLSETESSVSRIREMVSGAVKPLFEEGEIEQLEKNAKLRLEDLPDRKTVEKQQHDREVMIAAAAAQKQAMFDAWKFENAMRFREMQKRRRHRSHLKKLKQQSKSGAKLNAKAESKRANRRHRHVHKFNPVTDQYGSFFQQYYAHPRFQEIFDEDDQEDEQEEEEDKQAEQQKEEAGEKARFMQLQEAQHQKVAHEQGVWHALEYGNSMGNGADAAVPGEAAEANQNQEQAPVSGNAYGMPMSADPVFSKTSHNLNFDDHPSFLNPVQGQGTAAAPAGDMRFQQVSARASRAQQVPGMGVEQMTTSMFQPAPAQAAPALGADMRFQQVQQAAANPQLGNPNPGGVPMPFYPPSQAPPPAPNQMPAPGNLQAAMYPQNLVVAPSIGGGLANQGVQGIATGEQRFMAQNPNAAVNQYPFNSFIELDESLLVHPTVHKMAYNPYRHMVRTPLTEEHMAEFPLLS